MKRTKRNPAARAYFRAFYDGNRLNFGSTFRSSLPSMAMEPP